MNEIRRTYGLLLKFTEEEKKELFKRAKEMHLSKASYIRMCVFGNLRASEKGMYEIKKKMNSPKILKEITKHTLFQKELISEFQEKVLNGFKLKPIPEEELDAIKIQKEEMQLKVNNERRKINEKTIEILKECEEKSVEIY